MKNRSFVIILLAGLCVFLNSCKAPVATGLSAEDEAAIRTVLDKSLAIGNAPEKDFVSYVDTYYADDATIMPPNMPAIAGKANMVSFFYEFPPFKDFKAEILQIDGRDDLAYVRGTYSMNVLMPGAEMPVRDTGKYIEIWKKQANGGWKVYFDIFNSDLPLPAPEAEEIR